MQDIVFDLVGAMRSMIHPLYVVDIGAMALGDGSETAYFPLVKANLAEVIGFEPQRKECLALNEKAAPGQRFLPYAIGDGQKRTFYLTNAPMTSSLYRPNHLLLQRFSKLPELLQIVSETEMDTKRLDDVLELSGCDFLKIDVQGAELDVLHGASRTLTNTLVVETEVEFVPLYENQPLFAEVDQAMRAAGFKLYNFRGIATRTFAPLHRKQADPFSGQALWSDAIYFRDFMRLGELTIPQLLKLAVLAQELYGARDFVLQVLHVVEEKGGPKFWDAYCAGLVGSVKERPIFK